MRRAGRAASYAILIMRQRDGCREAGAERPSRFDCPSLNATEGGEVTSTSTDLTACPAPSFPRAFAGVIRDGLSLAGLIAGMGFG